MHHPKLVGETEIHQICTLKLMEDKLDFILIHRKLRISISHLFSGIFVENELFLRILIF